MKQWAGFSLAFLFASHLLAQSPAEISALQKQALDLILQNKATEAIPVLEKALAKYPDSPDVHDLLASAHSVAAEALEHNDAETARRRAHLEAAARHYRRTVELTHVNIASNLHSLAEIYLPGGLNQPREAERFARRLATDHPTLLSGHAVLARALMHLGRPAEAVAAMARPRDILEPRQQMEVVAQVVADIENDTVPERAVMRPVLQEARRLVDALIPALPDDRRVQLLKAIILELQAKKVEENAERRAALLAESEAIWAKGRGARQENQAALPPPPPPPPPTPPPPIPAAAEAAYRRGVQLWNSVNSNPKMPAADAAKTLREAVAAFDDALTRHPPYADAIVYKGLALRLQAKYEPDAARAKALLAEADRLRERAMKLRKQER